MRPASNESKFYRIRWKTSNHEFEVESSDGEYVRTMLRRYLSSELIFSDERLHEIDAPCDDKVEKRSPTR